MATRPRFIRCSLTPGWNRYNRFQMGRGLLAFSVFAGLAWSCLLRRKFKRYFFCDLAFGVSNVLALCLLGGASKEGEQQHAYLLWSLVPMFFIYSILIGFTVVRVPGERGGPRGRECG